MSKRVTPFKMFFVTLPAAGVFKEKKVRAYIDPVTGDIYGSEKITARLNPKYKNSDVEKSLAVVEETAKRLFPNVSDIKLRGKIVRETRDATRMINKNNGSGSKLVFQLM